MRGHGARAQSAEKKVTTNHWRGRTAAQASPYRQNPYKGVKSAANLGAISKKTKGEKKEWEKAVIGRPGTFQREESPVKQGASTLTEKGRGCRGTQGRRDKKPEEKKERRIRWTGRDNSQLNTLEASDKSTGN